MIARAAALGGPALRASIGRGGHARTALRGLTTDVRSVLRGLSRAPGYTAAAVGTLALGIGAHVAIFTVVNAVVLRPLPFDDSDRLVSLWFSAPGVAAEAFPASDGMVFTYRAEARAFSGIGAWWPHQVSVVGRDGAERLDATGVTADLLPLLGVEPSIGRLFAADDDAPGAPATVLLSHAHWQGRFGGDPRVLGRTLEVGGSPHEIVGVLPRRFALPGAAAAIYLPLRWDEAQANFGGFRYHAVARLRPDATLDDAVLDLARMIPLAAERYFNGITMPMLEDMRFAPAPRPLRQEYVGDVGRVLWIL
jgi:hypothetical protein